MATITSAVTGNWSAGATWAGGVVPDMTQNNAVIANGHTVTIDANVTVSATTPKLTITVQNGGWLKIGNAVLLTLSGDLVVESGGKLDITNSSGAGYGVTIAGSGGIDHSGTTGYVGDGAELLRCASANGYFTVREGGVFNIEAAIGWSAGAFTVNGAFTLEGYAGYDGISMTGGTLTVGGTFTYHDVLTQGINGGTVVTCTDGGSIVSNSGIAIDGAGGATIILQGSGDITMTAGAHLRFDEQADIQMSRGSGGITGIDLTGTRFATGNTTGGAPAYDGLPVENTTGGST